MLGFAVTICGSKKSEESQGGGLTLIDGLNVLFPPSLHESENGTWMVWLTPMTDQRTVSSADNHDLLSDTGRENGDRELRSLRS